MNSKIASGLSVFLTIIVVVLSICDLGLTVTCPWWLGSIGELKINGVQLVMGYNLFQNQTIYYLMLAFFILGGTLCFVILTEGYMILGRIRKNNPFCTQNALSLRIAAFSAFTVFLLTIFKMFFLPTFLTLACGLVFLLFGLFILVISELVRSAARIKEENDLTI